VDGDKLGKKEHKMPRTRRPYPPEFREQILELVRIGRTPNQLAREFEPSGETIHNCIKQAKIDAGQRHDGLTTDEKHELARLRKEVKQLHLEQEILAKAAAWFARATPAVPCRTK
jgi:transposase